jgi:hypothetical protein
MGKGRRKGKIFIPHPLKKPSEVEEKLHKESGKTLLFLQRRRVSF